MNDVAFHFGISKNDGTLVTVPLRRENSKSRPKQFDFPVANQLQADYAFSAFDFREP